MKGSLKNLCLIFFVLLVSIAVESAFADDKTVALQSIIMDNFDGTPYEVYGDIYNWTWQVSGSRYSYTKGEKPYPLVGYIQTGPLVLKRSMGEDAVRSLGIQGAFERHGYNWVDIYPTISDGDGAPAEIPLQGRPYYLDMWVWGSNLNYSLEAYVRDQRGGVHVMPMGSLRYEGWKNLRASFPSNMPMVTRVLPRRVDDTKFVKFRIWTEPNERVTVARTSDGTVIPFSVYFAQLKVFSDLYETIYDGDELADLKTTNQLWSEAGTAPAAAP
jgi:hypothetical protein